MANMIKENEAKTSAASLNRKNLPYDKLLVPGFLLALAFSAVFLIVFCGRNVDAKPGMPIPVSFSGEYSQNNGEWKPLTADTRLNALDGDLVLRGSFDFEKDTATLHVYLDGIALAFFVDGEKELSFPGDYNSESTYADSIWFSWESAAFSGKSVEIRLSNSMKLGNPNAYNNFFGKAVCGTGTYV